MSQSIQTKLTPLHSFREAASNLVSIGVLAYNEEEHIETLLKSLFLQSWAASIAEIIVIDNGSTDSTVSKVLALQEDSPFEIRVFKSPANHVGLSRAMIIELAQSPFVAFIDADCKAPRNWLETLLTQFQKLKKVHGRLAGVCGPNRLPQDTEFHMMLNEVLSSPLAHGYSPQAWIPDEPVEADHLPTTNCLFVRSKVLEVGNFSSALSRVGEDLELGRRMRKGLYTLILCPEPVVENNCADDLQSWSRRMFRFGRAQKLVSKLVQVKGLGPQLLLNSGFILSLIVLVFVLAKPSLIFLMMLYPMIILAESGRLCYKIKNKQWFWKIAQLFFYTHANYIWGTMGSKDFSGKLKNPKELWRRYLVASARPTNSQVLPEHKPNESLPQSPSPQPPHSEPGPHL